MLCCTHLVRMFAIESHNEVGPCCPILLVVSVHTMVKCRPKLALLSLEHALREGRVKGAE